MLETNKIYNIDCIEGMKQLDDNSIDTIITDPPYTTPVITGFGRKKVKNVADLSIQEQYIRILKIEFERILKSNGRVFIFCDDNYYPSLFRAFYDWHQTQMIVWNKKRIGMGRPFRKQHELIIYANRMPFDYYRYGTTFSTVMDYKPVPVDDRYHPAEKPQELVMELVKGFTKEKDTILDCFVGGGTIPLVCKLLNRNYIGFELNTEYFDVSNERLNNVRQTKKLGGI